MTEEVIIGVDGVQFFGAFKSLFFHCCFLQLQGGVVDVDFCELLLFFFVFTLQVFLCFDNVKIGSVDIVVLIIIRKKQQGIDVFGSGIDTVFFYRFVQQLGKFIVFPFPQQFKSPFSVRTYGICKNE